MNFLVSAINATQAVVTFTTEISEAVAANFSADNGVVVTKAEVNETNKKEVKLTFNTALTDKETYKVTVNGVKSDVGVEMSEAATAEFTYEIGDVSKIELTKTTFVNGDDVVDFVKLTNASGINVTDQYTVEISSTSTKVTSPDGTVSGATENETAYVQVTVKNAASDIVAQSDALKVTLAPSAVSSVVNFGLGSDVDSIADFKAGVKDGSLVNEMKLSDAPNLELLVNDNGSEKVIAASDVVKIENLTPTIATVTKDTVNDELKVTAFSTGTAQVKLTIGSYVTTVTFTVKADSKISAGTLSNSSVYFNTGANPGETSTVNVNIDDQYGKDIAATVAADGKVSVGGNVVGTLTAKSSNVNVATVAVDPVAVADSALPVTITEVGKGTATITVELKDNKGAVVFTKSLTVTGKDAGAFAGYVIETDATEIDVDQDVAPEANDDAVNFKVYEVDASGNKIQEVTSGVTLDIQGYDKDPEVETYITEDDSTVSVTNADAYKAFTGSGTLNVDVLVNGTKIGTKAITYKNSDSVATKAVVNTVEIVIDNDKISGDDAALTLADLFYGHYDAVNGKYTLAPKLTVQDQFGKAVGWDVASGADVLDNTDVVSGITFTTTNASNVDITGNELSSTVSLASGKTTGSFTVVVSDVDTNQVDDILSAPVAFKVTIVD